jgi:serine/threonine protein kinase
VSNVTGHPNPGSQGDIGSNVSEETEFTSATGSADQLDQEPLSGKPTWKVAGISLGELLARGLHTVPIPSMDRWEAPTIDDLTRLLPQYQIESLIGRGGMGAVYKGRQERLDRFVAIKLLPCELADDVKFFARFEREARTLAKLDHPGIVSIYDFGQTSEGHLYFVMEFIDGTDLHRLIRSDEVNANHALEIVSQVCEALQFAHSKGVIHRDIKPANILLTKDGKVKLADFGLARPMETGINNSLTLSHVVMGTPDYMAPEQKRGDGDHRVDLYALGVMLYEMLCGSPPQGAWQLPSQRVSVDVRLDQVVIKAMQVEPELRYQQALQVKTDLDAIRSSIGDDIAPTPVQPANEPPEITLTSTSSKSLRWRIMIGLAVAVPLIVSIVTVLLVSRPERSRDSIAEKTPATPENVSGAQQKSPDVAVITENEVVDSLHLKYRFNRDGTAHVIGYVGVGEVINIPAQVAGRRVTGIADFALQSNSQIREVTIAEGVEMLGSFAFKWCSQLESIKLPSTLKVIGPWAFESCASLNQPDIPDGVTRIAEGAFSNCPKILSFDPPPALRFLERYAFQNCIEIREVKIPETVEKMEGGVFAGCVGIQEFKIQENHPTLVVVDGVIFDRSLTKLVHFPPGRAGSYVVPEATRAIGHRSFYGCFDLGSITLPSQLKTIETQSFIQCNSLETVEIPPSVNLVMDGAFSNCQRLKTVRITSPDTVVDPEQVEKLGSKLILSSR